MQQHASAKNSLFDGKLILNSKAVGNEHSFTAGPMIAVLAAQNVAFADARKHSITRAVSPVVPALRARIRLRWQPFKWSLQSNLARPVIEWSRHIAVRKWLPR